MKRIIQSLTPVILLCFLLSCGNTTQKSDEIQDEKVVTNQTNQELPKLVIKTTAASNQGDEKEEQVTINEYFDAYFEMDLTQYLDVNRGFKAQKIVKKNVTTEGFSVVFNEIVDDNENVLDFKSTTDFLNYMDARGYEMVEKKETSSKIQLTFKRK